MIEAAGYGKGFARRRTRSRAPLSERDGDSAGENADSATKMKRFHILPPNGLGAQLPGATGRPANGANLPSIPRSHVEPALTPVSCSALLGGVAHGCTKPIAYEPAPRSIEGARHAKT